MEIGNRYRLRQNGQLGPGGGVNELEVIEIISGPTTLDNAGFMHIAGLTDEKNPQYTVRCISGMNEGFERNLSAAYIEKKYERWD